MDNQDKKIEQMMNEEGLSHAEAMARIDKKSKKEAKPSGTTGTVALPATLLPDVPTGKDVDVSICGNVTGQSGGMVQIKTTRFSVSVMEPMKPMKGTAMPVEADDA